MKIETVTGIAAVAALFAGLVAPLPAAATGDGDAHGSAANPPAGFIAPPLNPKGVTPARKKPGVGTYALLADHPVVDNSGFVVGDRGVLVIDAHINGAMARQILDAVRAVTDKPILYLVNTNYHGDHTFGNDAFPRETTIVAHRETAARMRHFDEQKRLMLRAVDNNPSIFADARLRLPDVTFDTTLAVDLGGRKVHIHHFGPGNTPGDTVVYDPRTKTA